MRAVKTLFLTIATMNTVTAVLALVDILNGNPHGWTRLVLSGLPALIITWLYFEYGKARARQADIEREMKKFFSDVYKLHEDISRWQYPKK